MTESMLKAATLTDEHTAHTPHGGPPPALEVRGLWAGYNRRPALEDVTFQAAQGDIVGVIGPNGSGKSTLLKAILGLLPPWRGQVLVMGQPAAVQQRRMGYMPQVERVDWDFPVTVGDVALMGRYARRGLLRRTTREDREAASAALERVGMLPLRDRLIGELSGGQRRRALLARALANNPVLLLLDEPMAGLDATAQHQLLDIIGDLQASGTTIVLCTHDLSCVSICCAKALCLNRRQVAFGPPDAVLNETVLNETFGTHLLLVHGDGQAYAYRHHTHPETESDAGQPHGATAADRPGPAPRRK
jgi:ABC-type Mn2+/Zn2+ transport system ATPase subunit